MLDFYSRREHYKQLLLAFLRTHHDLYLLTGMYGNVGDHLIWGGTRDILKSGGIKYQPIPMSQLDGICQIRGTLLVPGSGAFDQLWHEWLPNTVAKVTNLFQKVIILPSSYDVSVPVVAQCLALPTVYALAREAKSYAAVKYFGRAALFFDCAVYFQEFEKKRNPSGKRRKYGSQLIAFRTDKGSLLPTYGFIPNPELNEDISLTKNNLDDWIYAIEHVGTVVTDRLHIALAAVLLGKQLIFLDSYNMKLSTYFAYTFRDTFDAAITKCSIEWLIENKYVLPVRAYA